MPAPHSPACDLLITRECFHSEEATCTSESIERRLAAIESTIAEDISPRLANLEIDKAVEAFVYGKEGGVATGREACTQQMPQPFADLAESTNDGKQDSTMVVVHQMSSPKVVSHQLSSLEQVKREVKREVKEELAVVLKAYVVSLSADSTDHVSSRVKRQGFVNREKVDVNRPQSPSRGSPSVASAFAKPSKWYDHGCISDEDRSVKASLAETCRTDLPTGSQSFESIAEHPHIARRNGLRLDSRLDLIASIERSDRRSSTYYEMDMSMWDAGLLFFVRSNGRRTGILLLLGMVCNLFMQIFFCMVIIFNMLSSDFDTGALMNMIEWRVAVGHSDALFDKDSGRTVIAELCQNQAWSYEGDQYQDMYLYLYQPIPGSMLSFVAIFLWVLTTVGELRQTVKQFEAVLALPSIGWADNGVDGSHDGVNVVGIHNIKRAGALLCIVLPRLVICSFLSLAGCRYLAQTVSPADIVLNAVALAFVLDADERLAEVVLTSAIQLFIKSMRPVVCDKGTSRVLNLIFGHELRLSCASVTFLMVFSLFYWLVPFAKSVEAATVALCGGSHQFTYTGGTEYDPLLRIAPVLDLHPHFVSACTSDINRSYVHAYYPNYLWDNDSGSTKIHTAAISKAAKRDIVMQYALSSTGCQAGEIRYPPHDPSAARFFNALFCTARKKKGAATGFKQGKCKSFKQHLREPFSPSLQPGESRLQACPRLDVSLGAAACASRRLPQACLWSHEAHTCEGPYPGAMVTSACKSDPWWECKTWEKGFGTEHPSLNCNVTRSCPQTSPRCLDMTGWLELAVDSVHSFLDGNKNRTLATSMEKFANLFTNFTPHPFNQSFNFVFLKGGNQSIQWAVELKAVLMVTTAWQQSLNSIHIHVVRSLDNMSAYGLAVEHHLGTATFRHRYTFPSMSVPAGSHILVSANVLGLKRYLGPCESNFYTILNATPFPTLTGLDVIELLWNGEVIESFGRWNVAQFSFANSWIYKDASGHWLHGLNPAWDPTAVYPFCFGAFNISATCRPYACSNYASNQVAVTNLGVFKCCPGLTCNFFGVAALCPSSCLWSGRGCSQPIRSCTTTTGDCIAVKYDLQGISVHLPFSEIFDSNASLLALLQSMYTNATFKHAIFIESSVQIHIGYAR